MSSPDCIHVTNREFLLALFTESLKAGARAWVCAFAQDPSKAKGAWKGQSWTPSGDGDYFANISKPGFIGNRYFSLSTFTSDKGGRKTNNAAGCHAIILDDVGTKAGIGQELPEPTWVIETSPDNYQYGYAFDEPIRDLKRAQDFFRQLAQKQGIAGAPGLPSVEQQCDEHVAEYIDPRAKARQEPVHRGNQGDGGGYHGFRQSRSPKDQGENDQACLRYAGYADAGHQGRQSDANLLTNIQVESECLRQKQGRHDLIEGDAVVIQVGARARRETG